VAQTRGEDDAAPMRCLLTQNSNDSGGSASAAYPGVESRGLTAAVRPGRGGTATVEVVIDEGADAEGQFTAA